MTNTAMMINDQIEMMMRGRGDARSKRITEMGRSFYREGGFDDVALGEMIFSCAAIIDAD